MSKEKNEDDSRKLDSLALRSLELVERLLTERRNLELAMRQGFLHMAKSRYTMGKNSVSCLQLPSDDSRFESIAKVRTLTTVDGTVSTTQFSLLDIAADREEEKRDSPLRRRTGTEGREEVGREKTAAAADRDPIRWFGILVPQDLRACQRQFKEAVAASCRVATCQNELEAVRTEYRALAANVSSAKSSAA